MSLTNTAVVLTVLLTPLTGRWAAAEVYDPLQVDLEAIVAPIDATVRDASRQREIPVRIYLPADLPGENEATAPAPVVLFSHGLGGSRENNPYLGRHWAARGYAVVFMQHVGSDESVWQDVGPLRRMAALRNAASAENFMLRAKDVPAVLDQLAAWNAAASSDEGVAGQLAGRFDLTRVGMSGHSFGAVTTQAVSGQAYAGGRVALADPRIAAAVLLSPSTPRRGDPAEAFGGVNLPWLLMTGTRDEARIGGQTAASRRQVFPALPPGDKYELVLDGAEHSAFGDRKLPGDQSPRNPNHHRAILALSTAFWDAYLRDDAAAKSWLQGDGPRSVLQDTDLWQQK